MTVCRECEQGHHVYCLDDEASSVECDCDCGEPADQSLTDRPMLRDLSDPPQTTGDGE